MNLLVVDGWVLVGDVLSPKPNTADLVIAAVLNCDLVSGFPKTKGGDVAFAFGTVTSGALFCPKENILEGFVDIAVVLMVAEAPELTTDVLVRLVANVFVVFPVLNENPPRDGFEKLNPAEEGMMVTGLEVEVSESVLVDNMELEKVGNVGKGDVTPGFPKLN